MISEATSVLDASALLAYLQDEPGADLVAEILIQGAALSAVNLAEVLSKLAERGQDPNAVAAQLTDQGLLGKAILVYPLDETSACVIAKLHSQTRALGLSLGDCACLALALSLGLPAFTADRNWGSLDLGCTVIEIRP